MASVILTLALLSSALPGSAANDALPTYHRDVLPILQEHCLDCHRAGDIGPMSLTSYREVRPWSAAIREAVKLRTMPPWFADPQHGEFANDPRLSENEIATIERWHQAGAPEGVSERSPEKPRPAPLPDADLVLTMPAPFRIPADAVIDYQYVVFALPFESDRWVQQVEIRPGDRSVVHHAVLYVRDPQSPWLRDALPGVPYAPPKTDPEAVIRSRSTTEEILAVYTPGARATMFSEGMAKKIPAGADLVLQLHYTSKKTATTDRSRIALSFSTHTPRKRILTLQMGRDDLRIPAGDRNYRATVAGTLPNDALLVSLFPHMHLRGVAFEFDIVRPGGRVETLLRVKPFLFHWQLNYILKEPRLLPAGTMLRWTGYFDNSGANPWNPDPDAEVTWGEQSWEEMMIGFFDVAVDPGINKHAFFDR